MDAFDVTLANRRKPWDVASWADGQRPISDFTTAADMLEAAGLNDWQVRKAPEFIQHGNVVVETGKYATVDKNGRVLGTGRSDMYTIIQNEDAFAFGDAIVDSGEAKWERAGQVRNGETVFGCMELMHLGIKVPGDDQGGDLTPYLLIVNSFGGWAPFSGRIAFIRPVCINTFQAAYGTKTPHKFSFRHTGTLDGKLAMAREALGIAFQHAAEVKELVGHLSMQKVVDRQVKAILDKVWPNETKDPSGLGPKATEVWEQYQTSPTLEGIRGTGWGVLNTVTEYLDHVQEYKPRTGNGAKALELRGLNLMLGTESSGEVLKERALKALLALRS